MNKFYNYLFIIIKLSSIIECQHINTYSYLNSIIFSRNFNLTNFEYINNLDNKNEKIIDIITNLETDGSVFIPKRSVFETTTNSIDNVINITKSLSNIYAKAKLFDFNNYTNIFFDNLPTKMDNKILYEYVVFIKINDIYQVMYISLELEEKIFWIIYKKKIYNLRIDYLETTPDFVEKILK